MTSFGFFPEGILASFGLLLIVMSRPLARWTAETFPWQPWPKRMNEPVYLAGYRIVGGFLFVTGILSLFKLIHFR
jgi:hypothetical protein